MTTLKSYSINDTIFTGTMVFYFWQKCIKNGVPENKEALSAATQQADICFNNNYDTNSLICQKQFINKCVIDYKNGITTVNM